MRERDYRGDEIAEGIPIEQNDSLSANPRASMKNDEPRYVSRIVAFDEQKTSRRRWLS